MYRQSKNQAEKILIEKSLISKILQIPANIRQKMIWALLELSLYGECSFAKGLSDPSKEWFFSQISTFDWMIYQKNNDGAWMIVGFVRTEDRQMLLIADPPQANKPTPKNLIQILKNTPQFSMQSIWQSKVVHLSKEEKTTPKANPQDLIKNLFKQQGISLDEQNNAQPKDISELFKPLIYPEELVEFEPFKHLVISAEQAKIRRALIQQRDEILLIQGARGSGLSLGLALSVCESIEEKQNTKILYITPQKAFYEQLFKAKLSDPNRVICLSFEDYYQAYTSQDYVAPPSMIEIKKFLQKHIKQISKPTLELFQGIERFAVFFAYFINQALPEIEGNEIQANSSKAFNISLKHFNIFSAKAYQGISAQAEEQLIQQLKKLLDLSRSDSQILDHLKALSLLNQNPNQSQDLLTTDIKYFVMDDACQYNRAELKALFDSLIRGLGANEKHWKIVLAGEEGNFFREQLLKWEEFKDLCALQFDRKLHFISLEQNEKWNASFVHQYFNPMIQLYDQHLPFHLRPRISRLSCYLHHSHKQQQNHFKQLPEHILAIPKSSVNPVNQTEIPYFFHKANYNTLSQNLDLKRLVFMLLSSKQLAVLDFDGQLSQKIKLLIQNELFTLFEDLGLKFEDLNILDIHSFMAFRQHFSILFLSGDPFEHKELINPFDISKTENPNPIQQSINALFLRLSLDYIRWIFTRSNHGVIVLNEQNIYLNQENMQDLQSPLEKLLALGHLFLEEIPLEDCLHTLSKNHFYEGYEFFEAFAEAQTFQAQELWLSARHTWVNLLPTATKIFGQKGLLICQNALDQIKQQALEVAITARDWRSTKELLEQQSLNHQLKVLLNQQVKKQAEQLLHELEAQDWGLFDRTLALTQDLYTLDISQEALNHICEALWKSSQKLINAKEHLQRQGKIFDRLYQLKESKGYALLALGYQQDFEISKCSEFAKISLAYLDYCKENANKTSKGAFVKGTLNHLKAWVKNLVTHFDENYEKSDALFCLFFATILLSQKDLNHANVFKEWAETLAVYEGLALEKTKEYLSFQEELKNQPFKEQILELRQRGEIAETIKQYQKFEENIPPELNWMIDLQHSISHAKSTVSRLTDAEKRLMKELALKLIQAVEEDSYKNGNNT